MTYDNKVEFWSRCGMCLKPLEILKGLGSAALFSLLFKGRTYDTWLCDECAGQLINRYSFCGHNSDAAVKEEKVPLWKQ